MISLGSVEVFQERYMQGSSTASLVSEGDANGDMIYIQAYATAVSQNVWCV